MYLDMNETTCTSLDRHTMCTSCCAALVTAVIVTAVVSIEKIKQTRHCLSIIHHWQYRLCTYCMTFFTCTSESKSDPCPLVSPPRSSSASLNPPSDEEASSEPFSSKGRRLFVPFLFWLTSVKRSSIASSSDSASSSVFCL